MALAESLTVAGLAALTVILVALALALGLRLRRVRVELARLHGVLADRVSQMEALRGSDGAVLERLPDPVIVLDTAREICRTNAAARSAFGAELGAVLRHPGLRAAIDRALGSGAPQAIELSLPVPVPREVRAALVPLHPPLSDGGRLILMLSDRTRERAIERMRADFVANASHELRTPLASLIGFIDTLRGPAADDPVGQRRFLGIMAEQAARMNRLIDDLLSLSRIELTEHQPPRETVDLAPLLSRLAAGFEPRRAERGARIETAVPPGLPKVAGDADQLAQVVQNLIDNALKYGREDGTVRVAAAPAPSGGRWPAAAGVVLAVSDDGPGIARAHLPRLTERFYRVDKSRSRSAGGTGLGLAIVKHVVSRHRGRLVIESEEGVGTTVSVWLPAAASGGSG